MGHATERGQLQLRRWQPGSRRDRLIADSGLAFRLIAERQNEDYWRNFGTKENSLIAPSLS